MKYGVFSMALLLSPVFLHSDPAWVSVPAEVPLNAVQAGSEADVPNYVCRSVYQNAVHPGKYLAGKCNIEFAGQEVVRDTFEVLTAEPGSLTWIADSNGGSPVYPFEVGNENGRALYSCRSEVYFPDSITDVGMHAGKLVGENCNIPYGGKGFQAKVYEVLSMVVDTTTPVNLKPRWNPNGLRYRIPYSDAYGVDGRLQATRRNDSRALGHQVRLIRP